jgi:hypothetical protein
VITNPANTSINPAIPMSPPKTAKIVSRSVMESHCTHMWKATSESLVFVPISEQHEIRSVPANCAALSRRRAARGLFPRPGPYLAFESDIYPFLTVF